MCSQTACFEGAVTQAALAGIEGLFVRDGHAHVR